jgi:hypothetical protein
MRNRIAETKGERLSAVAGLRADGYVRFQPECTFNGYCNASQAECREGS